VDLTPELVQRLVEQLFGPAEQASALEVLERYGSATHEREPVRVRVAALRLCEGRLADLDRLIAHARRDYRDVLAWAEYPTELANPTWRMPDEDVARIRASDRAQYLAWLEAHAKR
jgi:hypothetical protein